MDYALWILAILVGVILGRFTVPKEKTPEEETCDYQRAELEKEVQYYKKLTKALVDENMDLRRKLDERT